MPNIVLTSLIFLVMTAACSGGSSDSGSAASPSAGESCARASTSPAPTAEHGKAIGAALAAYEQAIRDEDFDRAAALISPTVYDFYDEARGTPRSAHRCTRLPAQQAPDSAADRTDRTR